MVHLQGGMLRCNQLLAAQVLPKKHLNIRSSFAMQCNLIKMLHCLLLEGSEAVVCLVAISNVRHADLENAVIHYTNLLKANITHTFWQPLFLPLATLVSLAQPSMIAVAAAL